MTKNDKLGLAYKAFKDQLKAAQTVLQEKFHEPLKKWVDSLVDKERVIDGSVKLFFPKSPAIEAKDAYDDARINDAFTHSLVTGVFKQDELQELLASGGLVVTVDSAQAAKLLESHRVGTRKGYTIRIPGHLAGWRDELRADLLDKGRFDGTRIRLAEVADIAALMVKTADSIEMIDLSPKGRSKVGA